MFKNVMSVFPPEQRYRFYEEPRFILGYIVTIVNCDILSGDSDI